MNRDLQSEWARLFVHALAGAGVSEVIASPGSRSTPLALAAFDSGGVRVTTSVDERSAAFFALGQARVTGKPSLLLCTSGTAGAHYLPAVIEAERAHLPLIAVTADRPWELTQSQANQTVDQTKLFGHHVRGFFELGEPTPEALRALPRIAVQSVLKTQFPVSGPVHINARFRKPLEPIASAGDESWRPQLRALFESSVPTTSIGRLQPSPAAIDHVADLAGSTSRGLVVAGPAWATAESKSESSRRLRRALAGFLRSSGFAFAAEAASDLLHGPELSGLAVGGLDAWLADLFATMPPQLVIRLGAPPISAAWQRASNASPRSPQIVVAPHGIADPTSCATDVVLADASELFQALAGRMRDSANAGYREHVVELATRAEGPPPSAILSEPQVARLVTSALQSGTTLFLGNSQVVRDVDRYGGRSSAELSVLHQRGASGIDGLIAGAAGARSVTPTDEPVVAMLGDVSALHDVGSLALAAQSAGPLVLLVVNNGGGRIFEQLPVAQQISKQALESLFVTPPPSFLAGTCAAFGVAHQRADSSTALSRALADACATASTTVLEVMIPAKASAVASSASPQQPGARS